VSFKKMDRIGFLSSLPFVIPWQSPTWPPAPLGASSTKAAKTVLIGAKEYNNLHRTFLVSMEIRNIRSSRGTAVRNQEDDEPKTLRGKLEDESIHRPAFFSVAASGATGSPAGIGKNDPSLSIFELALVKVPPNDEQGPIPGDEVFIRINEQTVFLLDVQHQCAHIEVVPSTTVQREGETSTRTLPCSLLLQFQNVSLRIFTMNDSTSAAFASDDADVQATFQEVLTTLRSLVKEGGAGSLSKQHRPSLWNTIPTECIAKAYRLPDAAARSPGSKSSPSTEDTSHTTVGGDTTNRLHQGDLNNADKNSSSTTSPTTTASSAKKRAWQPESSPMSTEGAKHSTELNTPAVSNSAAKQPAANDDDILPEPRHKLQRHVHVFRQSVSQMEKLRRVVQIPVASIQNDDRTSNETLHGHQGSSSSSSLMQGLLNSTALYLSQSYVSQADRAQMEETYDALVQEKQKEMDALLQSFFPSVPSHQQRRGQRLQHHQCSSAEKPVDGFARKSESGAAPDVAQIAEQCTQWLQEQKRRMQERYKLYLLPSRG
jgi:hypothetical protein